MVTPEAVLWRSSLRLARIASATSGRGCVPSTIVAPRLRYVVSTYSFHPSAAANSSGCLPNEFVVRVPRRSRIVSSSATRQTMWSNRSHTATRGPGGVVPGRPHGIVYVGSEDDKVYALNATTGATLWTATTGGGVQSSPAVANGVVYVDSNDGNVYAYKP